MSKNYVVKGSMRLKFELKKFTKTVAADDEASAKESALCILGGNHGVRRFEVKIDSITEEPVKPQ
jgi:ribosomal protein L20A (L18A)